MDVRFTAHGNRRLQDLRRLGITAQDVLGIIEHPIARDLDPLTAETVDGLHNRRRIRVVYVPRPGYYLIITVYEVEVDHNEDQV